MALKKFFCYCSLFIAGLSFAVPAFADFESDTGLGETGLKAGYYGGGITENNSPAQIVGLVIGVLLGFVGVVFLGLMIYGGFTWMMSRGNQSEVDKAKKMIEQAIIGLIIVLAAYAITYFVGQALGKTPAVGPD